MEDPKPHLTEAEVENVKNLAHQLVNLLNQKIKADEFTIGESMGALMLAVAAVAKTIGAPDEVVLGGMSEALQLVGPAFSRALGPSN